MNIDQSNIFRIKREDRPMPAVPVFLDINWGRKAAQVITRKIDGNEMWIEIRPFLPTSVRLKEGDVISGRFALPGLGGYIEFKGKVERVERFALSPNYNFLSLVIIKIKKLPKRVKKEIESIKRRVGEFSGYEKTDPLSAVG